MQWSEGMAGGFEKGWGSYFLTRNEWFEADWGSLGRRVRMRGICVTLVLSQEMLDEYKTLVLNPTNFKNFRPYADPGGAVFGAAVQCLGPGYTLPRYSMSKSAAVGVIDDDLECGRDIAEGCWVTVQQWGHHDSVRYATNSPTSGAIVCTFSTCLADSISAVTLSANQGLQGTLLISAVPAVVNFDGVNTPETTWATLARLNPAIAVNESNVDVGSKADAGQQIIGWKPEKALVDQGVEGGFRGEGFIMAMGMNVGR